MIDRIEGVGGTQPIKGPQGGKVEKSKGKAKEKEEVITEAKDVVSKLIERIRSQPEVREKLVEDLKKALQSGLYSIDPEKIAEKILGGG